MTELSESVARKLLGVVDAGLTNGVGNPVPGEMCVEAAVCYALDEPHGDNPSCVAPALRSLKIRLNDSKWSNNGARARGMRRLALAQLGSACALDEKEFAVRCARLAIQTCVPAALRAAAGIVKQPHKDKMLTAADLCERDPIVKNARAAEAAARSAAAAYAAWSDSESAAEYAAEYAAESAAWSAAWTAESEAYAAWSASESAAEAAEYAARSASESASESAAEYAAWSAAWSAALTAESAAYAAWSVARSAASAAAAVAAPYAKSDEQLATFAEGVVQILIDMKAPGCQWLFLTEDGA